eukprot:2457702-Amphidinium_carterae.2
MKAHLEGGKPTCPTIRISPLSAPDLSSERHEHYEDVLKNAGMSNRRGLNKVMDDITVHWCTDVMPYGARWLLDTELNFYIVMTSDMH